MSKITKDVLGTVDYSAVKELFSHIENPAAAIGIICFCGILSLVSLAAMDKKTETNDSVIMQTVIPRLWRELKSQRMFDKKWRIEYDKFNKKV